MPATDPDPITIEDVDREIESGSRWLSFSPAIEAAFETQTRQERVWMLVVSTVIAIVLYDMFLINDWLTLNDAFPALLIARLGIFTPISLCVIATVLRYPATREPLASFSVVLAMFLPTTVMVFSESPYRLSYQFGTLLIMVFSTVILRLRFRHSAGTLLVILIIQCTATYLSNAFDYNTYVANCVFYGTAVILFFLSGYLLEHSDRRSFLFSLRGQLLQAQLEHSARTDALTGLFNRRRLAEVTTSLWAEAEHTPRSIAIVLIDIDHFKAFNDNYGHLKGDTCLKHVSHCIEACLVDGPGITFRFGGEEILIVLPEATTTDAVRLAEAVRVAIRAAAIPHPAMGENAIVTASVGVASAMAPFVTSNDLIATADLALYSAKRAGRDCVFPARDGVDEAELNTACHEAA